MPSEKKQSPADNSLCTCPGLQSMAESFFLSVKLGIAPNPTSSQQDYHICMHSTWCYRFNYNCKAEMSGGGEDAMEAHTWRAWASKTNLIGLQHTLI